MTPIEQRNGYVLLTTRVQPKASRNEIIVNYDNSLRVALTAPPVEGEANKALCVFLAEHLGIPKRAVTLVSGAKSRVKKVSVAGLDAAEVWVKMIEKKRK
ncbi:MAG TPA: DUF167 domain-containing protein [Candidatus Hydrogenedentes bacterium]|nr:DUF167 domain-containing protein [Candidatus Hydrogenedentota bacterium]